MIRSTLQEPLSLVVPMYNEERRASRTVGLLVKFVATLPAGSELVFVDDGSTDDTAHVVEAILTGFGAENSRVIRRPHAGKGAAVRAGLHESSAALAGFCDIDLATPLESLLSIALLAESCHALAIGSRDVIGARVLRHESLVREFLGRAYNRAVQAVVAPGLLDTQCGAKVARREVWDALLLHSEENGFAWDVEICALATAMRIDVVEVPVEWSHDDDSGVNVLADGMKMLAALPRIKKRANTLGRSTRSLSASLPWQARTIASLFVGLLRRYRSTNGLLLEACPAGEELAAHIGWDPRAILRVDLASDSSRFDLGGALASVIWLHSTALDSKIASMAAELLAPHGLLVATVSDLPMETVEHALHSAGLRIEMITSALSWTSETRYATGPGRGSLLLGAIERVAICRLGLRPPRGVVRVVVARRLAPS